MARLTIFDNHGFTLSKRVSHDTELYGGGKRGICDGSASSASFRRLRDFCVRYYVPGVKCLGITLTIPCLPVVQHYYVRYLWRNVSAWCAKHKLPLIWRVELQQRGQAHFHCVLYGSPEQALMLFDEWYRVLSFRVCEIVDGDLVWVPCSYTRGANYACMFEYLDGSHKAFRYLVSHASKSKQCQLGFVGRQWGVVCREKFVETDRYCLELDDFEYIRILRWLRRLTRSRINLIRGCSSWLCNPQTIIRMISFLRDDSAICII